MRSSPVAPVPVSTDRNDSSSSTTVSLSTSKSPTSNTNGSKNAAGKDFSLRRHKATQPQFLTATKQFGNYQFQSSTNPFAFSTLNSEPLELISSSMSTEEDNNGDSNPATDDGDNFDIHNNYDALCAGRDNIDDVSHASTDDPYTYSDDSASLSDNYFLQQPSPDSRSSIVGYSGLFPPALSDGEQGNSRSTDTTVWPGPPWIHSNEKSSHTIGARASQIVSSHSSSRYAERNQRRYQRQERNVSPMSAIIDREEPINESTSLLDDNRTVKIRQRDRDYHKKQKFVRAKKTVKSVSESNAHQQHRKKHQLRKHKRNILLQEQQNRQQERERAVSEIRGRPQPLTTTKDRYWSILFIFQLFLVFSCAIKYGLTFYRASPPSNQGLSYFPSSFTTMGASDEIRSTAASSMLLIDFENEDTIVQPETIDRPLSTSGFSNSTDESKLIVNTQDKLFTIDYINILSLLVISGTYACMTSYLSFAFMLILSRSIIPVMLVFTIMVLMCWGVFGLSVDTNAGSIISLGGFTVFGMSFAYTISTWNHIPFCSTNLYTAICAMRSSFGILLVGISSLFVGLLWLLIWTIALMGIFNRNNSADCELWDECETHVYIFRGRIIEVGLLCVSLYWTTMVIKNIVRVAVAGAIGGPWWFSSGRNDTKDKLQGGQRDRCCCVLYKSKIADPLFRACTSSFGTICFGSLVDLPAQLLSIIVSCLCWITGTSDKYLESRRSDQTEQAAVMSPILRFDNDDNNVEENSNDGGNKQRRNATVSATTRELKLLPSDQGTTISTATYVEILKLHLRRLDRVLRCCNRWSYCYIGIYNYSFYEGGEKAIQLFETREWMDIARDSLIQNILLMASIVIGGSSGMVAVLVEEVDGYEFSSLHKPILTSFLIGFFLGFILSNILLLGLVGSAVNTVLVCFAAEPFAFDRNHPHLSREMREVWSQQVWEPDGSSS